MKTKEFRTAVVDEILEWAAAAAPTLPIIWENGPVPDEDKIGPIWLDVSIRWYGGQTLTIGEVIKGRHTGVVSLQIFSREGQGTADPDTLIDSLTDALASRRLGTATIKFPQRTTPTDRLGWYKVGLLFPFSLDHS